jgi:hypothetical protein
MNTVRIGVIAICAAVGASVYWSLRGAATDDVRPTQEIRALTDQVAASDQIVSRNAVQTPDARTLVEPDAPELLPPSRTFDQVLDAVNADIGPEGEYVDPEALAARLRSDPELRGLLNE